MQTRETKSGYNIPGWPKKNTRLIKMRWTSLFFLFYLTFWLSVHLATAEDKPGVTSRFSSVMNTAHCDVNAEGVMMQEFCKWFLQLRMLKSAASKCCKIKKKKKQQKTK